MTTISDKPGSCPTCGGWAKTAVRELGGATAYRCAQGHKWSVEAAAVNIISDCHNFDLVPTTVYVAGPMAGQPDHNFPAFEAACHHLRRFEMTVLSPHEHVPLVDLERAIELGMEYRGTPEYRSFLLRDLGMVAQAEVLVLLPDWEESLGVAAEVALARALGIQVLTIVEMLDLLHGVQS